MIIKVLRAKNVENCRVFALPMHVFVVAFEVILRTF